MNTMLELNHKIVKKLKHEVEQGLDKVSNDDMLWVDQLSRKGIITPIKIVK